MNKTILMGNLTRDPETRHAGQTSVTGFGLAVNRRYTSNGEKKEEVLFVDCEAWGKTGEIIAQYVGKGRPLLVEGRLKLDQWEDKVGGKRSKIKVVVESFYFVGAGEEKSDKPKAATQATKPRGNREPIADDDIPF